MKLERIQRKTLKNILRKPRYYSTDQLYNYILIDRLQDKVLSYNSHFRDKFQYSENILNRNLFWNYKFIKFFRFFFKY